MTPVFRHAEQNPWWKSTKFCIVAKVSKRQAQHALYFLLFVSVAPAKR